MAFNDIDYSFGQPHYCLFTMPRSQQNKPP